MRIYCFSLLVLAALLVGEGCKSVECGEGTIESNGDCVPADQTVAAARCGPFTMLVGDTCTPVNQPTKCGPGTVREADPTGVGICKPAGGGGGCGAPISCPTPATGKQTICGQLYDFATREPFEDAGAQGTRCAAGATMGPCALAVRAFDAIAFATSPGTATPLVVADTYVDDCGRYRLTDITPPTNPFIGLGIDDAAMAMAGPAGITNTVGLATPRAINTATKNLEAFVAPKATTDAWASSGGPALSGGIYAMVFRARSKGTAPNPGVTMTRNGTSVTANDHYFAGCSTLQTSIDTVATATGGNGTALVTGASLADGITAYSGTGGGLPAECSYSTHAGVALPFILFVQILRPTGGTCTL
jgi:hypothetical protein